MIYKTFELKSTDDKGHVEGYASTWTKEPDSYGDIVIKGAFKDTIEKKKKTGHPFPLCYGHDLDQIIGKIDNIEEDDTGLKVAATFLDTPLAQEKRELVKEGIVWQFSFAYDVLGSERPTEEERKQGILNKLTKLDLYEVSLVPIPANQTAIVTDVKSGRRNSSKDEETIRGAISALNEAASALEALLSDTSADDNEGKDKPKANADAKEPKASNPEKAALLDYINGGMKS